MAAPKATARKSQKPAHRAAARGGRKLAPAPTCRRTRTASIAAAHASVEPSLVVPDTDVIGFARTLLRATPMQLVEAERRGLPSEFVKQLAFCLGMPLSRLFAILALPKATAERKAANGDLLIGESAHAALGVTKLLAIVDEIAVRSTAPVAGHFDVGRWVGEWLELPQPALGGRKAADPLDTPTGLEIVARALGAVESGAYQ